LSDIQNAGRNHPEKAIRHSEELLWGGERPEGMRRGVKKDGRLTIAENKRGEGNT